MTQTNINVRLDPVLKNDFEMFCSDVGLTMSSAICLFVKKVVRDQTIPFEISSTRDPFYSPENQKALQESIAQLHSGKVVNKSFEQLEAMLNG